MATDTAPILLTQDEAAKLVRCSVSKLARERYQGRLAYVPGRPVLLRLDDVLAWLDRRRKPNREPEPYDPVRAARRSVLRKRARNHTP